MPMLPESTPRHIEPVNPDIPLIRKPVVYLAHPFSTGDTLRNLHDSCISWQRVRDLNVCIPINPLWSTVQHAILPQPYEDWLTYDFELITGACHALIRFPGKSPGAEREVRLALDIGIPVFHINLPLDSPREWEEDFVVWCRDWTRQTTLL